MDIKLYRKNDNILNKFKSFSVKEFKFYPNYIYLSAYNSIHIWHKLSAYTIKELYYVKNIIFIYLESNHSFKNNSKKFYLKLVFSDKKILDKTIRLLNRLLNRQV